MAPIITKARPEAFEEPIHVTRIKGGTPDTTNLLHSLPNAPRRIPVVGSRSNPAVEYAEISPLKAVQKIENVQGCYFVSNQVQCSEQFETEQEDIERQRRFTKAVKPAERIQRFLNAGWNGDAEPPAAVMLVRPSGFVKENGSPDDMERFTVTNFHETSFVFPGSGSSPHSPFFSTDFWSVRSSNLKAKDGLLDAAGSPKFDSIEIGTGLCLWAIDAMAGPDDRGSSPKDLVARMCWTSENAEAVLDRLESSPPTLYEIEAICRLSSAIADIAATIHHRLRTSGPGWKPIRINLDLPDMQYHYLAVQARKSGHCTSIQGQRYVDIVQKRRSRMAIAFGNAIKSELAARGIASPEADHISIFTSSGSEAGEKEIRRILDQDVQESVGADIRNILSALCHHHSLWDDYLDLLGPADLPTGLEELGGTGYVFQILKPILQKRQERRGQGISAVAKGERVLMVQVDSTAEWPIYVRAEKLLKKLQQQQPSQQSGIDTILFGVFPLDRILTLQTRHCADLYFNGPGQRMWERGASEEGLNPLAVARKVFSSQTVEALRKSFYAEGLLSGYN